MSVNMYNESSSLISIKQVKNGQQLLSLLP